MPFSILCFIISAVVILLQVLPISGVFLMLLMGPLWSALLINLGFLLMILEVKREILPRKMLILPALYFGGYGLAVILSNIELYRLRSTITELSSHKLTFDASADSLVFGAVTWDIATVPVDLIYHGYLNTSYVEDQNGYSSLNVGDKLTCDALKDRGNANSSAGAASDFTGTRCIIRGPQKPPGKTYVVTEVENKHGTLLLPRNGFDIKISGPTGRNVEMNIGQVRPLFWLPFPVIGCGLNDHPAKWSCSAFFVRHSTEVITSSGGADRVQMIADALGLKPSPLTDASRQ